MSEADPPLLAPARQGRLLRQLEEAGEVRVAELAAGFGVTDETVRRDLKQLEERGVLRRVHGGAVALHAGRHASLAERVAQDREAKEKVARLALPLLAGARRVFLGEGTVTLALARALSGATSRLQVATNMPEIAAVLAAGGHEAALTGGTLHPEHLFLHGYDALDWLRGRRFDLAVTGTSGVDPMHGFLDFEEFSAALRRLVAVQATRSVVVTTSRAFGQDAPVVTFPLSAVHALVVERPPPPAYVEALAAAGVELIVGDIDAGQTPGVLASGHSPQ